MPRDIDQENREFLDRATCSALAGLCANPNIETFRRGTAKILAERAVDIAIEALEEREKFID